MKLLNLNHYYLLLIAVLGLLWSTDVSAEAKFVFKPLPNFNAISTTEVRRLYQDKDGYLWIATTSGLYAYDGYQIRTFKNNAKTPYLLTNNNIRCMIEDDQHRLYIGTNSSLNVLDKSHFTMSHINHPVFNNVEIEALYACSDGSVLVGTVKGLVHYDPKSDSCSVYRDKDNREWLTKQSIAFIGDDSTGHIWIGTYGSGLYCIDSKTNICTDFSGSIAPNYSVLNVLEDSQHRIWVGTWDGLYLMSHPYDPARTVFNPYLHQADDKRSLSNNIVYALAEDMHSHSLWVGTRSGLSILDLNSLDAGFVNYLPGHKRDFPFNEVDALISDSQGGMWVGMLGGGVYYADTKAKLFKQHNLNRIRKRTASRSVRSLMVDQKNRVWLGIGSYGFVLESEMPNGRSSYTYWQDIPAFENVTDLPTINTIVQSPTNHKVYLGTFSDGVYVYDERASASKQLEHVTWNNCKWLPNINVYSILEDTNQNMWYGTRTGLCYVKSDGDGFSFIPCYINGKNISQDTFRCITQTADGAIWAGTDNDGVIRIVGDTDDPASFVMTQYALVNGQLNSNDVQCIFEDSKGRLWIGTDGGGLSLYDEDTDRFLSVNEQLDIHLDGIFSIEEANDGMLWMGTNGGLFSLFTPDYLANSTFHLYDKRGGLQDNTFLSHAAFKTSDGKLFFGGHKGYNSFYPSEIKVQHKPISVLVTDIKVFNTSWHDLDDVQRTKVSSLAPEYTRDVRFNYDQNNFTIEFSSLDYFNIRNDKFAYRLDGFEEEWHVASSTRHFAYYNNLDAGTYYFRVKAMGENSQWGPEHPKIRIVVLPPMWATWWAKLSYCVFVILLAWLALRIFSNRMILENRLRLGRLEKEKLEELNQLKLKFFTNVTHELLTPLAIIRAGVEELKLEAPHQVGIYQIMDNNIVRLMHLLRQMLEFRKSETGNLKLSLTLNDLVAFVQEAANCFKPLTTNKQLHFTIECPHLSMMGYFDTDKLDKIIYNLLSNAAKYNSKGGYIKLSLDYGEDKDFAVLKVADNGRGISPENMKSLFSRFYDGEYRKFRTSGTGIGLALVKDLVELHRGSISVDSEVDKGTTFDIVIPIKREYYDESQIADSQLEENKEVAVSSEIQAVTPCVVSNQKSSTEVVDELDEKDLQSDDMAVQSVEDKSMTLLLVEDNEDLLALMSQLLSHYYQIVTATNGEEALDIIAKQPVDIIVSDILMPVMDGIHLCRVLKSDINQCHIPIILLTAKTEGEDRTEAYDSGADAFIAKPFNVCVLRSRIRNLIRAREHQASDFKHQLVFEAKKLNFTSLDEDFLNRAIACVNNHLDDSRFDQKMFVEELGTSKSTLYKKLKSLTGLNTSGFIRNIRLKSACKLIDENGSIRISDLAYTVGFNNPKYFSTCFRQEFGLLPSEYMEKKKEPL